jgi:signal transduction histidine kinase
MRETLRARLDNVRRHQSVAVSEAGSPYLLLAVLAVTCFVSNGERGTALLVDSSLCAVTAAWIAGMYTLNPARRRPRHAAVFIAGLLVLTGLLTVRSGWFGFFIVVAFGYSRVLLRWPWPMVVGAAAAVIGALAQTDGNHSSWPIHLMIFLVALTIDLALFPAFMWLIHDREQQVEQHRKSLTELGEANRRLEATIAENEVLHRQLLTQARAAGVRDERRRMAREIHDTLAQGLTGIVTQLQAAEQAAARDSDGSTGWRHHVDAAIRLARESLVEARRSVDALRPEPLDGCRLSEAVVGVADRWSALNGVPVQVTTTGTVRPIQPEAEFALLRAAQEALANVARHAHASRVGLTISYMENEVALDVRDDGVGFDPAVSDRGFGLVAMRQRIAALYGTLQVESEPGGGTAISACVPTVSVLASS